jgi:pyruvate kinase
MERILGEREERGPQKIIATVGPASSEESVLRRMADAGMSVARLNFSHGTREGHREAIKKINGVRSEEKYRGIAVALDTKGPEIRTGVFRGGSVFLEKGRRVKIVTDKKYENECSTEVIYVDHRGMAGDLEGCSKVYLDDGKIELKVLGIGEGEVETEVVAGGSISSRKGVNIPEARISLPGTTEKDRADLRFGMECGIDMVFASFVRSKTDILEIREIVGKEITIVAKIESMEGLLNIDEILEVADGVMVARGDLGIEVEYDRLFSIQAEIQEVCTRRGVPFVIATQMLESMCEAPRPRRAEITDVGFAAISGADCIMLSGESASGDYPVESVDAMRRIAANSFLLSYTERVLDPREFVTSPRKEVVRRAEEILACEEDHVVEIESAEVVWVLSQMRKKIVIALISDSEKLLRKFSLCFGVHGLFSKERPGPDASKYQICRNLRQITLALFG